MYFRFMKVKTKAKSGSVKIDPSVLKDAKAVCVRDDVNIQDFVTEAVKEKVKKVK